MSINLGTYALVSALAIGGVVAQHQYSQPARPPDNAATAQQNTQQNQQQGQNQTQSQNGSAPMGATNGPLDCNTFMTHHQQVAAELDRLDRQVNDQLTQVREAKSDRTKLEATVGVVETLVAQRKQIRDQMTTLQHESMQLMLSGNGTDLKTSCPQITEWLQKGATNGVNTDQGQQGQGGPNDMELQR